ncbi:hypothetical protein TNCV_653621 [Trichonephila clavipes]|nr:hypothetical protein TNCV_653621 [Trichonephila clavipes]
MRVQEIGSTGDSVPGSDFIHFFSRLFFKDNDRTSGRRDSSALQHIKVDRFVSFQGFLLQGVSLPTLSV